MPSAVFDSVFGGISNDSKPSSSGNVSANRSPLQDISTIFKNVLPLSPALYTKWFNDVDSFALATPLQTLRDTVDHFKNVLEWLLTDHESIGLRDQITTNARALFAHSLPRKRLEETLHRALFAFGVRLQCTDINDQLHIDDHLQHFEINADLEYLQALTDVNFEYKRFIRDLHYVGLAAGDIAARACAKALDNVLDYVIGRQIDLQAPDYWGYVDTEDYVASEFVPFVETFLFPWDTVIEGVHLYNGFVISPDLIDSELPQEARFWMSRGVEKMAKITADRLYGLIISSEVEDDDDLARDIGEITSTPAARDHIARELQFQLGTHLLHPGSSTVAILDAYVQIIWALRRIDSSGILLVRAADQITKFLQTRDDAVRIVILSLLEPGDGLGGEPLPSQENFSGQIARLMKEAMEADSVFGATYYPGKDLKDVNWDPEPADAFSGYRAARYRDAMGHMVTIRDNDAFIDELRGILGERLLTSDALSFDQEERLLAMFKNRFEEIPIRECEIMLKDMKDSLTWFREVLRHRLMSGQERLMPSGQDQPQRRITEMVIQATDIDVQSRLLERDTMIRVKVLSHTYWPAMRSETFELPPVMQALANEYSKDFESIKPHRRLEWLNAQGRVTVNLELADRVVSEEVTSWQAAVIWEFGNDDSAIETLDPDPVSKSVAEIENSINMDEDLVRSALTFWVSKLVLQESISSSDTYTVLERLSDPSGNLQGALQPSVAAAAAAAQAETAAAAMDLKTPADLLAENAPLYTAFVINMLTNQGHMPSSRMMMMLKMLVAGGFPFEDAEFNEFLQGLAEEGKIEKAGGLWMAKKQ